MSGIYWTSYDPLDLGISNEDPLGFYAYALRLADEWLPGITTRTRRIRYYSMVCGGLKMIEEALGDLVRQSENQDAERTRLFMRWERLWVLWSIGLPPKRRIALIGSQKAEKQLQHGCLRGASLDYPFIQRQPDLGALGAYKTSLQAFDLMQENTTELKAPSGCQLAELFWESAPNRRAMQTCAKAVRMGRYCLGLSEARLLQWGSRLGVDVDLCRAAGKTAVRDEVRLLRDRLLSDSRRTDVLTYVRRHRLLGRSERDILGFAAKRALKRSGNLELEERAAVIVAFEEYRKNLLSILASVVAHARENHDAICLDRLAKSGDITRRRRLAHGRYRKLIQYARTGKFTELFDGCTPLFKIEWDGNEPLLRSMLECHEDEMAARRSPRWFVREGKGTWQIDPSIASDNFSEEEEGFYSPYRTHNLIRMAREVGCRL